MQGDAMKAISGTIDFKRPEDVAWDALEVVLGMERPGGLAKAAEAAFKDAEEAPMHIGKPWSQFLQIWPNLPKGCKEQVHFTVEQAFNNVVLLPNPNDDNKKLWENYFSLNIELKGEPGKDEVVAVFNPYASTEAFLTPQQFKQIVPSYNKVDENFFEIAKKNVEYYPECDDFGPEECKGDTYDIGWLHIPSGFFDFVEKIDSMDFYFYSIFPRQDVIGMLTDESISSGLSQNVGDDSGASAWVRLVQGLRRAATSSMLVGYGDGSLLNKDKKVQFGWVVARNEGMEPVQKAQLALVSVPAWTNRLKLQVTTGWLDRNSKEQAAKSIDMDVPLPPYYEAFDSFIQSNELRRKPKILNAFLDNIEIEACHKARILIPGYRLWRSTTVTLGAQQADRITVLPNMEGIIAEFNPVDIPDVRPDVKPKDWTKRTMAVGLRVWTSEGMDLAEDPVTIRAPRISKGGRCPLDK